MMIVRDGWPFIFIALFFAVAFLFVALRYSSIWLVSLAGLFALLTVFTAFFFRNPNRVIPAQESALVSPADGKVVAIVQEKSHPFFEGEVTRISVFLSVFDVHVNRTPLSGTIDFVDYNPGKFFAAFEEKASKLNEQTEIGMISDSGHKVVFKQIAGLIARRIVCNLKKGQKVMKGELFGLIRFGSRCDIIMPSDYTIQVAVGDRVEGGSSILALLPEMKADEGSTDGI